MTMQGKITVNFALIGNNNWENTENSLGTIINSWNNSTDEFSWKHNDSTRRY